MAVLEDLSEEEKYLLSILLDESGVDIAEFCWRDADAKNSDGKHDWLFRCWNFQYYWYRCTEKRQIDETSRAIGKSVGIQMRAFSFPFTNPDNEMLLTAPEMIHLDPVTKYVEDRLLSVRLSREMLRKSGQSNGINKRPFEAKFTNGAKIIGRIPQKDGRGVKGMHPRKLEIDEAQDFPEAGWIELMETLKYGDESSSWRIHGVSRGVRDRYYKLCQPESGFYVHRITAMHRPDWTDVERKAKAEYYGSKNHPDYRRNILGKHGDATSPLFVLSRLMQCCETEDSDYTQKLYYNVAIREEHLKDSGMPIESFLDLPGHHKGGRFKSFWGGMDVGMTQAPTEILIFGEEPYKRKGIAEETTRLCLITRVHLERISSLDQRRVMRHLDDFYGTKMFAMDKTGVGLPIYQDVIAEGSNLADSIRGYNFSEKILVGWDKGGMEEEDVYGELDPTNNAIMANVLEFSSDQLRLMVDQQRILLPWDTEVIREFQGQTYVMTKSNTNPYGKKEFNKGTCHALDASRMAVLAYQQSEIEPMVARASDRDAVLLEWLDEGDIF